MSKIPRLTGNVQRQRIYDTSEPEAEISNGPTIVGRLERTGLLLRDNLTVMRIRSRYEEINGLSVVINEDGSLRKNVTIQKPDGLLGLVGSEDEMRVMMQ